MSDIQISNPDYIHNLIYTIRGIQVMLDSELAKLYGVETKQINRAVSRNKDRFPGEFVFQLNKNEWQGLRYQIDTLKKYRGGHRKYLPFVFTEQGVAMLSTVLRSETAVKVSIRIINAFVVMRKFIGTNAQLFQKVDRIELKQLTDKSEIDEKFERVFDAIEQHEMAMFYKHTELDIIKTFNTYSVGDLL